MSVKYRIVGPTLARSQLPTPSLPGISTADFDPLRSSVIVSLPVGNFYRVRILPINPTSRVPSRLRLVRSGYPRPGLRCRCNTNTARGPNRVLHRGSLVFVEHGYSRRRDSIPRVRRHTGRARIGKPRRDIPAPSPATHLELTFAQHRGDKIFPVLCAHWNLLRARARGSERIASALCAAWLMKRSRVAANSWRSRCERLADGSRRGTPAWATTTLFHLAEAAVILESLASTAVP